MVQIF